MQFIAVACGVSENVVKRRERAKVAAALLVPQVGRSPGNEVTSAPGTRFFFKPVSEEYLIPGALYSVLGCRRSKLRLL